MTKPRENTDIKVIFTDVHGTILPESSEIVAHGMAFRNYIDEVRPAAKKLVEHLKQKNIKLVVLTAGSIIEALEVPAFIPISPDAYYIGQGGMRSFDAGKTWSLAPHVPENLRHVFKNVILELKLLDIPHEVLTRHEFTLCIAYPTPLTAELHNLVKKTIVTCEVYIIAPRLHLMTYKTNTKATAINEYLKLYNIAPQNALFYGNSTNDMDALLNVEHKTLLSTTIRAFPLVDLEFQQKVVENPQITVARRPYLFGLIDYIHSL